MHNDFTYSFNSIRTESFGKHTSAGKNKSIGITKVFVRLLANIDDHSFLNCRQT